MNPYSGVAGHRLFTCNSPYRVADKRLCAPGARSRMTFAAVHDAQPCSQKSLREENNVRLSVLNAYLRVRGTPQFIRLDGSARSKLRPVITRFPAPYPRNP